MALLYKHFTALRIVFCVISLGFYVALGGAALAEDALFVVKDVEVDVTAEDASKARSKAFAQAQYQAFQVLAGRMMNAQERQSMPEPDLNVISTLIKDFEVTKEKLSQVRYIGTYTFRFDEDSVRNFFGGQGLEYTGASSKPVLILPFYEQDNKMDLWSPYNPWLAAWKRTDMSRQELVPLEVPLGDLEDVSDIGDDQAFNYRNNRLQSMLRRYNAEEAVLAIARPDDNLAFVENAGESASGTLVIDLYRTDRAGPEPVKRLFVKASAGETREDLYMRATREVQQALLQNWKEQTATHPGSYNAGTYLPVRVRYGNLQEWTLLKSALGGVRGVDEVDVQSMSARQADINLVFQGEEDNLKRALSRAGFTLSAINIDPYAAAQGQAMTGPMYELRRN